MHGMNREVQLPPDRGHIGTECRHPRSMELDAMSTGELIELIADDHRDVARAVDAASTALTRFVDELVPRMRRGGRLVYLGAGTSGRLGVLDASECPPTFNTDPNQVIGIIAGGDSSLRKSSEGREDEFEGAAEALESLQIGENDTLLGIAAGGTTPYVLGAISIARGRGAMTGLLTCAPPLSQSAMPQCDHLIVIDTGPELLTGSTRLKAGSATKLALNIISTSAFIKLGKVYSNLMVDVRATNAKLIDRAVRILREIDSSLSRAEALQLLNEADGQLKTAIVMRKLNMNCQEASQRLAEANGALRHVLEGDKVTLEPQPGLATRESPPWSSP